MNAVGLSGELQFILPLDDPDSEKTDLDQPTLKLQGFKLLLSGRKMHFLFEHVPNKLHMKRVRQSTCLWPHASSRKHPDFCLLNWWAEFCGSLCLLTKNRATA